MDKPERILHLYTLYFPQGGYEAFLETEIPYLVQEFDEVRIFPFRKVDKPERPMPEDVKVVYTEADSASISAAKALRYIGTNITRRAYLQQLRYQLGNLRALMAKKERLRAALDRTEKVTHYSYWFDEWATVLGMLAKDGSISGYVSRAHGFDVYDDRQAIGYHPYRGIQLNGLKRLFPVSRMGEEYLSSRLSGVAIESAYLGTDDHGEGPMPPSHELRIISIAKIIPLKRITDIVKVLSFCRSKVHWTHIGDGELQSAVEREVERLPKHITAEVMGAMPHDAVMDHLRATPYHFLLSLSSTEGLPVSMMEVMSFGIPVISTDVGGVSELVDEESGIMIPDELDHEAIAQLLDDQLLSGMVSTEFRAGVRRKWKSRFSAEKNYPAFIRALKS